MFFFFTNPILIAAAVIPAVILLILVNKSDKLEKEPPRLLLSLVIRGVIATFAALVAERLGSYLLDSFVSDKVLYNVLMYFVVVACSEEGFKYLLLRRRTWRSPDFNCQFDGVVYAVFVSLGFALWENIGYVAMYGLETALIRALTAVPGHACFGVFMGTWYGLAKRYESLGYETASRRCLLLAFLVPVLAHGFYDYIATSDSLHYAWVFLGFIAVMFAVAYTLVRRVSRHDAYFRNEDAFGDDMV